MDAINGVVLHLWLMIPLRQVPPPQGDPIGPTIDTITALIWSYFPRVVMLCLALALIALVWDGFSIGITLKRVVMAVFLAIVASGFISILLALVPQFGG